MSEVLHASATFFLYATLAIFAQNALFARGIGVSRVIQLIGDDDTSSERFGLMLVLVCTLNAPLAWVVNRLAETLPLRSALRPLGYVLCTCAVCGALYLVLSRVHGLPRGEQLCAMLPNVGFNTCVAGTLLVATTQDFTLVQSIGFGLGSGLGFFLAVLLVAEARRRLQNGEVPQAFRGLPIVMIYIGILALAIYGFTGHAVII